VPFSSITWFLPIWWSFILSNKLTSFIDDLFQRRSREWWERSLNRMIHQFRNNIEFSDELNSCRETNVCQAIMRMIRELQFSIFNIDFCVQLSSSLLEMLGLHLWTFIPSRYCRFNSLSHEMSTYLCLCLSHILFLSIPDECVGVPEFDPNCSNTSCNIIQFPYLTKCPFAPFRAVMLSWNKKIIKCNNKMTWMIACIMKYDPSRRKWLRPEFLSFRPFRTIVIWRSQHRISVKGSTEWGATIDRNCASMKWFWSLVQMEL
jgi:hypothetical protein